MKIRKNIPLAYWPEAVVALFLLVGGVQGGGEAGVLMVAVAAVAVLYCVADYLCTTLECNGKMLKGRCGIIKRITLKVPLGKVQYCSLDRTLIFTTVKINAVTGTYLFKNMSNAGAFVDYVTERM